MEALNLIAAKPSVMHELLLIVAENTNLSDPPEEGEAAGAAGGAASRLDRLFGADDATAAVGFANPGDPVTREFARLNRLVTAEPAGIEQLLLLVDDLQREVDQASAGGDLVAVIARGGGPAARRIRTEAGRQPEPVKSWLTALGGGSQSVAAGNARAQLVEAYRNSVDTECRRYVDGRYPFDRNSQQDVAIDDFGRVFGYGGVFDKFFEERLAPVVDRSGTRWKVREGSPLKLSAALLEQFQQAEQIREVYFKPGSLEPEVVLSMVTMRLDFEVQRFVFDANGQTFSYQHGPEQSHVVRWPGEGPGTVRVMFEEASGGRPTVVEDGPWALFRLLDGSEVRSQSDLLHEVDVTAGSRSATLRVEARSVTNIFTGPRLHEFRCRVNP